MNANPGTPHRTLAGPAGAIEVLVDTPAATPVGVAIVAHPQPLLGGSATHKIPALLARAARDRGWLALRPNFRGVGGTAGVHDHGIGETDDLLAVVGALRPSDAASPLALIGFSFGAFVQARASIALARIGRPADAVVLAGLPTGAVSAGRTYHLDTRPPGAVVVHGERDEQVPLAGLLDWARRHDQPVTIVPGADHFFKSRLVPLRLLVENALAAAVGQFTAQHTQPGDP